MDVQVFHNDVDITDQVVQYSREHKICTGIGMLEMEVAYTYSTNFNPWDVIEIYENGIKSGKYFVSSTSEGQPNSTIEITAQDGSKRLSDYFLAESILVDYPSYTKFWIDYFLDEVGIAHSFTVSDSGSLLSNNTSLGLMSAYEQITTLLQMSGWYITFDYNGAAKIGKVIGDGTRGANTNDSEIVEIKTIKSDKMLRNRVVVWGKGDSDASDWVFADVSNTTRWNYDSRDKRAIVISNGNIRHSVDAFSLANKALLEFSQITIEKHLTLAGSKNLMVGDRVSVENHIFTGSGKVTTFGTSMSKDGLVTNIILDERCPRLFTFFSNVGGFVYVGTYGSGVWRKHIDPTWSGGDGLIGFASGVLTPNTSGWFNYSSGLMDLAITDLHVNEGVLASVTASGHAYYSIEDSRPWSQIVVSGLPIVYSGGEQSGQEIYPSGIMSRACIIDKTTGSIRLAVDTRSGMNYGDFLYETDPLSGIMVGSGVSQWIGNENRSWILDVNPYNGVVVSSYSINLSGNYNYFVFDIDHDGSTDYVSAGTTVDVTIGAWADYGNCTTPMFGNAINYEQRSVSDTPYTALSSVYTYSGYVTPLWDDSGGSFASYQSPYNGTIGGHGFYTDGSLEQDWFLNFSISGGLARVKVVIFHMATSVITGNPIVSYTSPAVKTLATTLTTQTPFYNVLEIRKTGDYTFDIFVLKNGVDLVRYDYQYSPVTTLTETLIATIPYKYVDSGVAAYNLNDTRSIGAFTYIAKCEQGSGYISCELWRLSHDSGGFTIVDSITLNDAADSSITNVFIKPVIAQIGDFAELVFYYLERTHDPSGGSGSGPDQGIGEYNEYVFYKYYRYTTSRSTNLILDEGSINGSALRAVTDYLSGADYFYVDDFANQFNKNKFYITSKIITRRWNISYYQSTETYIDDFQDSQRIGTTSYMLSNFNAPYSNRSTSAPEKRIFTTRGPNLDICYAFSGGATHRVNVSDGSDMGVYSLQGYTIHTPLGVSDRYTGDYYFLCRNDSNSLMYIVCADSAGSISKSMWAGYAGTFTTSPVGYPTIVGNIVITRYPSSTNQKFTYLQNDGNAGMYVIYRVMKRDAASFSAVKSGAYRERLEISNYSPLVTMDRRISSVATYYTSMDDSVVESTHVAISGYNLGVIGSGSIYSLGLLADDIRYSSFERESDQTYSNELLVVFSGGVGAINLTTLESMSGTYLNNAGGTVTSGGFISSGVPSGIATRIEISNFQLPSQYIFVAVSGYSVSGATVGSGLGFFQRDPETEEWLDYSSGYPQSKTTIIRLDDAI